MDEQQQEQVRQSQQRRNERRNRSIPQNELDFNLRVVDTVWQSNELSPELREKLTKDTNHKGKDGRMYSGKENVSEAMQIYTRDLRLANLSTFNNEVNYCNYYQDLANDFLQSDFAMPSMICLSRGTTVLELSQSRGGFLRKQMHTIRQESFHTENEPKKKNWLGFGTKTGDE
jgi:hypothetical protein